MLVTNADLFKPTYPKSKEKMIGGAALFFHQGHYHSQIRKLVVSSLSPESLKKLIPALESIAISTLNSLLSNSHLPINTFQHMKKVPTCRYIFFFLATRIYLFIYLFILLQFAFEVGILAIFGELGSEQKEELKKNYCIVDKGYNSFPTNLPGTSYQKALMVRNKQTNESRTFKKNESTDSLSLSLE